MSLKGKMGKVIASEDEWASLSAVSACSLPGMLQ